MAYKIAIGSSDGIHVNLKFGETNNFLIYEVSDEINLIEKRKVKDNPECRSKCCGGNGNGCSGPSDVESRVMLISDCRCVVCKKIGFQAQKQFEKKAISVFDVECNIEDALKKITYYYEKIDNHKSFRNNNRLEK